MYINIAHLRHYITVYIRQHAVGLANACAVVTASHGGHRSPSELVLIYLVNGSSGAVARSLQLHSMCISPQQTANVLRRVIHTSGPWRCSHRATATFEPTRPTWD